MAEKESLETQVALLNQKVEQLEDRLKQCVTETEFRPIRLLTFGWVGVVMTAVCGAILGLVLKGGAK